MILISHIFQDNGSTKLLSLVIPQNPPEGQFHSPSEMDEHQNSHWWKRGCWKLLRPQVSKSGWKWTSVLGIWDNGSVMKTVCVAPMWFTSVYLSAFFLAWRTSPAPFPHHFASLLALCSVRFTPVCQGAWLFVRQLPMCRLQEQPRI